MKNKILLIIVGVLLITTMSASLGTFKKDECVNIKTILDTSEVNISTISYPNSSLALENVSMEKRGQTFIFSFCNTSDLGTYIYDYYDGVTGDTYVNDFVITRSGKELTMEEAIIYGLTFAGSLILFFICFYFAVSIRWKNDRDQEFKLVSVSSLKYFKLILIGVCYALLNWILNLLVGLSDYLSLTMYSGFFSFMFELMARLAFPFIFVLGLIFLWAIKEDIKLKQLIKKGFRE